MKITPRNNKYPGVFIAVEGIDGCGKTAATEQLKTIIQLLLPDRELVTFRAPGGTAMGEKVRDILLNSHMSSNSELLLFMASHCETISSVIIPALERGAIVLTDRFLDSAYAYQGHGRQLLKKVKTIHEEVLDGFEPDHVIYVRADQGVANGRLNQRGDANRLDTLPSETKERIRNGMEEQRNHRAHDDPDRVTIIDNDGSFDELTNKCLKFVEDNLL